MSNQNDLTKARFSNLEIGDAPVKPQAATAVETPNLAAFKSAGGLQAPEGGAKRDENGTWRNALGFESSETHRHVAKSWQQKCVPLQAIYGDIMQQATTKVDVLTPESFVRVDANLRLPDGTPISEYGLETLRRYTGVPSAMMAYYLERENTAPLATEINSELDAREIAWAKDGKDARSFRIRYRGDGTPDKTARAFVSERYGVIDNAHAIQIIRDVLGEKGFLDALASHFNDNGDDITGTILMPDHLKTLPDSDYGAGFAVKNSEVGRYSFRIDPFIFRAICINGLIWSRLNSEVKINKRHVGKIDLDDLRTQVRRAIRVALTAGNSLLETLDSTREIVVPNVRETIALLARDNGLTISQGQAWNKGYDQSLQERVGHVHDQTAFGLINGLTRAAQEFHGESRTQMETVAGNILAPFKELDADNMEQRLAKLWESYTGRANELEEKIVKQYVYVTA